MKSDFLKIFSVLLPFLFSETVIAQTQLDTQPPVFNYLEKTGTYYPETLKNFEQVKLEHVLESNKNQVLDLDWIHTELINLPGKLKKAIQRQGSISPEPVENSDWSNYTDTQNGIGEIVSRALIQARDPNVSSNYEPKKFKEAIELIVDTGAELKYLTTAVNLPLVLEQFSNAKTGVLSKLQRAHDLLVNSENRENQQSEGQNNNLEKGQPQQNQDNNNQSNQNENRNENNNESPQNNQNQPPLGQNSQNRTSSESNNNNDPSQENLADKSEIEQKFDEYEKHKRELIRLRKRKLGLPEKETRTENIRVGGIKDW